MRDPILIFLQREFLDTTFDEEGGGDGSISGADGEDLGVTFRSGTLAFVAAGFGFEFKFDICFLLFLSFLFFLEALLLVTFFASLALTTLLAAGADVFFVAADLEKNEKRLPCFRFFF